MKCCNSILHTFSSYQEVTFIIHIDISAMRPRWNTGLSFYIIVCTIILYSLSLRNYTKPKHRNDLYNKSSASPLPSYQIVVWERRRNIGVGYLVKSSNFKSLQKDGVAKAAQNTSLPMVMSGHGVTDIVATIYAS